MPKLPSADERIKESSRLMAEILKILERSYLPCDLAELLREQTDVLAEEHVLKEWVKRQVNAKEEA